MISLDVDRIGRHISAAVHRSVHGTVDDADDDRAIASNTRALACRGTNADDQLVLQGTHVDGFCGQCATGADTRNRLVVSNLDIETSANRTPVCTGRAKQGIKVAGNC